ncbi:MAG: hypothetical protein IIA63_02020 [Nitrospinae bacterium]|nr:hypothetical protein [Nitrospinota bacterium]
MKQILILGVIIVIVWVLGPWPELLNILKIMAMIAALGLIYNSNFIIDELREANRQLKDLKSINTV